MDNALISVSDALRKKWTDSCFPKDVKVPFPTYFGDCTEFGGREITASVSHVVANGSVVDPFSRSRREKE